MMEVEESKNSMDSVMAKHSENSSVDQIILTTDTRTYIYPT